MDTFTPQNSQAFWISAVMPVPFLCFREDGSSSLVMRSTSETGGDQRCTLSTALAKQNHSLIIFGHGKRMFLGSHPI